MLQKETRQPRGLKPLGARDRPVASTARPPRGDRTAMSPSRFFVGSPPSSSSELNSLRSFVLAANASAAARFGSGKGAARSRRDRARPVSAGNSASRLTAWFDASERSAELGPCNASASGVVHRAPPLSTRSMVSARGGECDLLRGEFVFAQQSAEPVATAEAIELQQLFARGWFVYRWLREGWLLVERAVLPVRVVVQRVDAEDMLEMTAADDQQPVEALAAHAADPALGVRSRPRRPHRRLDDTDAFGAENLVEANACLLVQRRLRM